MNTQFDSSLKLNLFESSLENAAEQRGDITPIVLKRFFSVYPDAELSFAEYGMDSKETLQASMVDWALYCLMNWIEEAEEIEIVLFDAAKHHDFLKLDPQLTKNLFNTLIDVIESTVSADDVPAKELWKSLKQELNKALLQVERVVAA